MSIDFDFENESHVDIWEEHRLEVLARSLTKNRPTCSNESKTEIKALIDLIKDVNLKISML